MEGTRLGVSSKNVVLRDKWIFCNKSESNEMSGDSIQILHFSIMVRMAPLRVQ